MENDKPTYEELEKHIVELKKQNDVNLLDSKFQKKEKGKRAAELIIANIELVSQNKEKEKRAAELIVANVELAFQDEEKGKRAAELIIANLEVAFQREEKGKQAAELIIAKIELALLRKEKEKLAAELIIANLALSLHSELIIAKEKAEESDRLKTAFLQNMSHEIRTPINSIIGFTELLDNPDLSTEKRKSFNLIIFNSTNQLLSIVSDILTISSIETKQEQLNIKNICVNNIFTDLHTIFKKQASNRKISLYARPQLTDKQSEIYTDSTKLTQILTNLITNALKFTHEGFIEFGYNLNADNEPVLMEFYVKDSGIGIKKEMHEKIFERFRQADSSIGKNYGGTGLGLSISKGFIDLLGGKIWLQSEPETGSTFYFTIPFNPVQELENSILTAIQQKNTTTILVAEDNEFNYLFIEELLNEMDLNLIHAKDGKEAVDICKSNPDIKMVLMDIRMPTVDGYTATMQIKEFRPELPIIAQSAYSLDSENENSYPVAFDEYISKPINKNELIQKLKKYIYEEKLTGSNK